MVAGAGKAPDRGADRGSKTWGRGGSLAIPRLQGDKHSMEIRDGESPVLNGDHVATALNAAGAGCNDVMAVDGSALCVNPPAPFFLQRDLEVDSEQSLEVLRFFPGGLVELPNRPSPGGYLILLIEEIAENVERPSKASRVVDITDAATAATPRIIFVLFDYGVFYFPQFINEQNIPSADVRAYRCVVEGHRCFSN